MNKKKKKKKKKLKEQKEKVNGLKFKTIKKNKWK